MILFRCFEKCRRSSRSPLLLTVLEFSLCVSNLSISRDLVVFRYIADQMNRLFLPLPDVDDSRLLESRVMDAARDITAQVMQSSFDGFNPRKLQTNSVPSATKRQSRPCSMIGDDPSSGSVSSNGVVITTSPCNATHFQSSVYVQRSTRCHVLGLT
jgi:hypothetical protein